MFFFTREYPQDCGLWHFRMNTRVVFFSTRQYLVCMFQLQSYPVASGPRVKRRIDGRGWVVVRRFLRRVPNCTFLIIAGVLWILMLKSYKKNCYVKVIHTEIIHPAGDVSRALLYHGIPCKSPTKKTLSRDHSCLRPLKRFLPIGPLLFLTLTFHCLAHFLPLLTTNNSIFENQNGSLYL